MTIAASASLHLLCALACLGWMAIALQGGRRRPTTVLLALACLGAAIWALAIAARPEAPLHGSAAWMETGRSALWIVLLLHLHGRDGGLDFSLSRGLAWGGTAALLGLLSLLPEDALADPSLGSPALLGHLGLAVLLVLLAENVYRNAGEAARWHVNLPCIAVGGLAAFDLVLLADAVLGRAVSPALLDARAVLTVPAMALLAVAARRDRRWRRPSAVPRHIVFHAATLMVCGTFLLGVGVAGQALRQFDGGWTQAAQVSLIAGTVMALAVALASQSARSRIRRLLVDPFFRARYDYRREWMRCIAALSGPEGSVPDDGAAAGARAIRAVADAVDSPAGVLLLREAGEGMRWAGSWNAPEALLPPEAGQRLAAALDDPDRGGRVSVFGEEEHPVPPGLATAYGPLWLAVPLLHHREGGMGVVLLAPPRAPFALDAEVFALLRALGREVALFLAERRAAERLADGRRLQDYAARFAFVAHDVKNVSGQLKLVLANAEEHLHDPEFQQDMLLTVRASAARIDTLIARLRQPEETEAAAPASLPLQRLRALAAARPRPVRIEGEESFGAVPLAPQAFDDAVTHLLNNAEEASPAGEAVRLHLHRTEGRLVLDITDRGAGMTPDFIRDTLFRPLGTARAGGSGIGAWQARELLRRAGGDVLALSAPGKGTTMRVVLPAGPGRPAARGVAA